MFRKCLVAVLLTSASSQGQGTLRYTSLLQWEGGRVGGHGAITFISHFHLHGKIHCLHSALLGGDSQQTCVQYSESKHTSVDGVRVIHADGTGDTSPTDVHRRAERFSG